MELDLGLRISRAIENLTFSSTETETVFVLLAHLPGFKKDEIEISINEAGTEISISGGGERSSIETTISRRLMLATEVIERFQKVFRIPNGVDLDRIDAGFDEENAILIVLMPKLIKGDVSGVEIEEIKQGEDEEEEGEEERKEASLEQDKQEEGRDTSKEEEQEEKGEGKEAPITEDEQEEKGEDDEVLMKEKEQKVKGEGEEASFKEQQEKEPSSERNHEETRQFHELYEPETDQNGEPELAKEQMEMEQKIPREEIEEERGSIVVPDQLPTPPVPAETHDLVEEPPSSEASKPKEAELEKELQIPMAPPTPPVPVETPSSEATEPRKAEREKELQIPKAPNSTPTSQEPIQHLEIDQEQIQLPIKALPRQELEQEDEVPPGVPQSTETPEIDQTTDRSEEQRAQEGDIMGDKAPDQTLEDLRSPQEPHEASAEKDRDIASGIEGGGRESIGEEEGDTSGVDSYQDLALGEDVEVVKREGNGNSSEEKGRKKGNGNGKGKGFSLPAIPSLASTAFIVSLAILAFHFLRCKKEK